MPTIDFYRYRISLCRDVAALKCNQPWCLKKGGGPLCPFSAIFYRSHVVVKHLDISVISAILVLNIEAIFCRVHIAMKHLGYQSYFIIKYRSYIINSACCSETSGYQCYNWSFSIEFSSHMLESACCSEVYGYITLQNSHYEWDLQLKLVITLSFFLLQKLR